LRVERGDIVFAKLANNMEMVGRVACRHGTNNMFTDIEVISVKNFLPKDIKRYVLCTQDIVRKTVGKEKVVFT